MQIKDIKWYREYGDLGKEWPPTLNGEGGL